jgi:hypothetical protein
MVKLFHNRSIDLFKGAVIRPNPISYNIIDAIDNVCCLGKKIDREIFFELVITALDATGITLSENGYRASRRFSSALDNYISKAYICKENLKTSSKIVEHVTALENADWSIGKMLRQMLEFERQLQQVMTHSWLEKPNWDAIFAFAIMAQAPSTVFPFFLFGHKFIFCVPGINTKCHDSAMLSWLNFSTGMWSIIKTSEVLMGISEKPKLVRSMFIIPKE